MADKDKKRDPMPPPDATPEEIGEFWDTHSLADYWDETHEVEVQVNLKSRQNLSSDESEAVDQSDPLSAEQGWRKLKELIQSLDEQHKGRKKGEPFEELAARLLELLLEIPFVLAKSGTQPSGDARNMTGEVAIQAKNYSDGKKPRDVEIVGDINIVKRNLQDLQVYVLVISRDISAQSLGELEAVSEETGLDIVTLELTDKLSNLGALCVTFWADIREFFAPLDTSQQFLDWVQIEKDKLETTKKILELRDKLKDGIQTQKHVQEDIEGYLLKRFSTDKGFNPINLSQAIDRPSLESQITNWWETEKFPICCLEGKEGHGKTWLAAKAMNSICENENIVAFWLDSKNWSDRKTIFDLLRTCFRSIYPSHQEGKITKLQNKSARIWRKTLIVLDGANEWNAIEAAQRILSEYFRHESEWRNRVRFLLTTRPLDDYPDFEGYLWSGCYKISVDPFNDSELQEALTRKGLQLDDLPDPLKDIARIPRYFQRCTELRDELGSLDVVTKEVVLWGDLREKIERTDPQLKQKLGWHRAKDAQEILSDLAKQAKWTNAGPQVSAQLLEQYFPGYHEVRHDLEEQRITLEAGPLQAKLSRDHIVLGWALYLANLFDCTEFTGIKDFAEGFQNALEPIPSEDLRTKALFVALQITAISPDPDISQDQLSQKRAGLMLAWFHSHNAQITDEWLAFWAEEDPDAYAQVVEFELEYHNSPNYEEALIEPLAKVWLNKKSDLNRLALRLTKWLLPTYADDTQEDIVYTHTEGQRSPREKDDIQSQLLDAALSILSQRPERQFLKTLAHCYAILHNNTNFGDNSNRRQRQLSLFYEKIGRLMRWGYTEEVLGDLHWLAELAQADASLLRGVYGLADCLLVDLPPLLQRPLSKKELETRAFVEQHNRRFKPYIERMRNQERLLIGDSPAANGNYHGLDYLAVRMDLPDLHQEDLVKIEKILQDVSVNAKLGWGVGATLEDFCIENLLPWVAKYDCKSYAKLACDFKINTLNQKWAQFKLWSIHGLIFQQEDCEKITEAILGMKHRLAQDIQTDNSSSDTIYLTSLLTETLLFSASEDRLTDWFEFLASHEPLRISICYDTLPILLEELLPESIVKLAQQRLEKLRFSVSDNQTGPNSESKEFPEEEFWCTLYAYGTPVDENSVKFALGELKLRKPDSTGTYPMLRLALSNSKQFLDEMLIDESIQEHLFSKNGRRFIPHPYDRGGDVPAYDKLMSLLPQEIVGSFLCSPDRSDDLSQWGKELIQWLCSIFQGAKEDFDYDREMRFSVNSKVLQTWAEQDTSNFLQLANEYLTELSKFPQYSQALSNFTDDIRCLLLRFQPDKAKQYYHQWNSESFKTVYRTRYGVPTLLAQLWKVEYCNSPEHRQFRRELLEECLNDEEIMFMTLAALAEGGWDELWSLVTQEYIKSPYAKERNLGVSILPWFGTDEAIEKLDQLKSEDSSRWVREHATQAYEVAQQERSCQKVYRKALQTSDLFRISAVFEQMKPALSSTARWWHREVEKTEFGEEPQDLDSKLAALVDRFWNRWGNSAQTKRNVEGFGRTLTDYCRGEKLPVGSTPRIAPWWKPTSDSGS